MAMTVRLNVKTERMLNALAKRRRLSRSDVVREAIVQYATTDPGGTGGRRPYDDWLDVIGIVSLGVRDPARTSGEQLTALLRERRRARRPR
jgi:hypothetical protein